MKKYLIAYLLSFTLIFQGCASFNPSAKQKEAEEQSAIKNLASVTFTRTDDLDIAIGIFNADGELLLVLKQGEEKLKWVRPGKMELILSNNMEDPFEGDISKIKLQFEEGRHHDVEIGAGDLRSDIANSKAAEESKVMDTIIQIGIGLWLLVLAITTGSAGSIVLPPPDWIGADEEERISKEKNKKEEVFSFQSEPI